MATFTEQGPFQHAITALRAGQLNEAERLFKATLRGQPNHIAALNLLGVTLSQLGRFDDAEAYLRKALKVNANSDTSLYNYGIVLKELKRPADAFDRFSQALALNPGAAETWNNRGTVLNDLNRYEEAIRDFDHAIQINPRYAEAFCNKGKSLVSLSRFEDAGAAYDGALSLRPDLAEAWLGRGHLLTKYKQYQSALQSFQKALASRPTLIDAWTVSGNIYLELKRYDDALIAFDRALQLKIEDVDAWWGRGNAFFGRKQFSDAEAAYNRALALNPDLAQVWLGRGNALHKQGKPDEALVCYDKALALAPEFSEARVGRGNILYGRQDFTGALAEFDRALTTNPGLAEAALGRAVVFSEFKHHAAALRAFDRALAAKPDLSYVSGSRLMAKLTMCDWNNLAQETAQFLTAVREQSLLSDPFALLAISASPADQLKTARGHVENRGSIASLPPAALYSHDRIRVAYLSADFQDHPVAHLIAGLIERHNRSRFEITGISFGPDTSSPMHRRLQRAFEHFIDVRKMSDHAVAKLMRDLEIDIGVDLMGYTKSSRMNLFSLRPAPIQVNYLGSLGTIGAGCIDYVIGDKIALPFDQQKHFTEKIVHLPDCFLANDDTLEIAPRIPSREEAGLPASGFVFCSFNNSYKITPDIFEIWMRLLRSVEGSVLWLFEANDEMVANLRREAESRGIDADRLIFASRVPLPEHLARQRLAGLFLDTTPYNAGATGAGALWSGLPLLTIIGEAFVGRMAASMLYSVGLPELVTHSLAEYEAVALKIASEPDFCAALTGQLARNRDKYPLFDTARFARNIELAYRSMWESYRRGRPPAPFAVEVADEL